MCSSPAPILVIGRTGQLATALRQQGRADIIAAGRPELDFDRPDPERWAEIIDRITPRLIINAAAWTQVDLAETEKDGAARGNHTGPAFLAGCAAKRDIPFFHLSTDYVFDGSKGAPYLEEDPVCPATIYGRTKAEGEKAVLSAHEKSVVFRTAWVYAPFGKNFLRTMITAGAKNPLLRVVADQKGNPTSAEDLAHILLDNAALIDQEGWKTEYHGIFHAVGSGGASWYDLACETLKQAEKYGQTMPEICPVTTTDWPTPARRPADSRLDTGKLQRVFGKSFPCWKESVARTVKTLFEKG